MRSCRIDTYYVKRDEPYTKYKDSFSIYPYGDLTQRGPNTWKGHYGPYLITIIQKHQQHVIVEDDVIVEKDPTYKEDPNILYAFPPKQEIAQVLNKFLDRIYG